MWVVVLLVVVYLIGGSTVAVIAGIGALVLAIAAACCSPMPEGIAYAPMISPRVWRALGLAAQLGFMMAIAASAVMIVFQ